MVEMSAADRKFYKRKMKKIREALRAGNEAEANRHANELKQYFNVR